MMMILEFLLAWSISATLSLPTLFLPVGGRGRPIQLLPLIGLHVLNVSFLFAMLIIADGSVGFACGLSVVLLTAIGFASCIKYRILGEPILFTDVISLAELLKNPRFFLFSLPVTGWVAGGGCILALPLLFWWCAHVALMARLLACLLAGGVILFYHSIPSTRWAPRPDWRQDVGRLGILGMLVIYWQCWRAQPAPCPLVLPAGQAALDVVVIVQCESFADPAMFGVEAVRVTDLPAFRRAQAHALWKGDLLVSGFGAYTMRTEYGVLFGREEKELGFRQYDPLLTAGQEKTYALPFQLRAAGFHTVFMHPHSLAFYGRDRLMPAIEFEEMDQCLGATFTSTREDPYLSDVMLADRMIEKIQNTSKPLFLYAVTMENHAPWPGAPREALGNYLRHLQNSDAMLGKLMDALAVMNKRGLLVFFGDHRPSIPGVNNVTIERATPYVAVKFPTSSKDICFSGAVTPAALHHMISRVAIQYNE